MPHYCTAAWGSPIWRTCSTCAPARWYPTNRFAPCCGLPWFVGLLGDDAGWLHAGRPRREAARIALRLALRTQVAELTADAAGFAAAVAGVADRHTETWMPDQTYLQQAQPSTFGHYLL